ncbi:MAG: hypothetical protein ACP5M9_00135 [Candidatus Micrarchaeia archaeon]
MGNKKLRKIIKKSNRELVEQLKEELLKIANGKVSNALVQSRRKNGNDETVSLTSKIDYAKPVSKMIGDLYERMSGTSSEGESYTFAVGNDAMLLKTVQNKLLNQQPVLKDDAKTVYEIYKKFFPKEAEKIKI